MTADLATTNPEAVARAYGFTLAPHEVLLLKAPGGPVDEERAYRLRQALRAEACPRCAWVLCQRRAWTGPAFIPGHTGDGPGYACPNCEAALIHRSGPSAAKHWMELAPGQTVIITPTEPGPAHEVVIGHTAEGM